MQWRDIGTAPRDGRLLLLHDPKLSRWSSMLPPQRIASRDFICVGRWAEVADGMSEPGWVNDQRTALSHGGTEPEWIQQTPEPVRWCSLPVPPPGGDWSRADHPPPLSCYVLLFDPSLANLREPPMAHQDAAAASMVVGSYAARVHGRDPDWISDYVEESELIDEPGDFFATPIVLSPAYWMDLPSVPSV